MKTNQIAFIWMFLGLSFLAGEAIRYYWQLLAPGGQILTMLVSVGTFFSALFGFLDTFMSSKS